MTQQGLLFSNFFEMTKKNFLQSDFSQSTKAAVAGPENVCAGKSQERSIRQIPDRSAADTHYGVAVRFFTTSG